MGLCIAAASSALAGRQEAAQKATARLLALNAALSRTCFHFAAQRTKPGGHRVCKKPGYPKFPLPEASSTHRCCGVALRDHISFGHSRNYWRRLRSLRELPMWSHPHLPFEARLPEEACTAEKRRHFAKAMQRSPGASRHSQRRKSLPSHHAHTLCHSRRNHRREATQIDQAGSQR